MCQKLASILGRSLGDLWAIIGNAKVIGRFLGGYYYFLRPTFAYVIFLNYASEIRSCGEEFSKEIFGYEKTSLR